MHTLLLFARIRCCVTAVGDNFDGTHCCNVRANAAAKKHLTTCKLESITNVILFVVVSGCFKTFVNYFSVSFFSLFFWILSCHLVIYLIFVVLKVTIFVKMNNKRNLLSRHHCLFPNQHNTIVVDFS